MLDTLSSNSMFYLAYGADTPTKQALSYKLVVTLSGYRKAIINPITVDAHGKIVKNYNLQGAHIVAMSLSWAPYFFLLNCNEQGKECESQGYLKELMDELGATMNFTWESHKDINDDWGIVSKNCIFNSSGEWGGVMGSVINGDYQLSMR